MELFFHFFEKIHVSIVELEFSCSRHSYSMCILDFKYFYNNNFLENLITVI